MAKKNKKSRFGNPARAAADAAARGLLVTAPAELRLDRAMELLSPGFVQWLKAQSRPETSIKNSLILVDEFFDLYRTVESRTDPTALVPDTVREVMEIAGQENPLATLGLRGGVQDYVDYLAHAKLWTGTPGDLKVVQAELATVPGADAGADDFADVYLPELTREDVIATVADTPLWKNVVALLRWIAAGKELTENGTLVDQAGAVATLSHSGVGQLGAAAAFTTPQEHDAARLSLYWELVDMAGLISSTGTRVNLTEQAALSMADVDSVADVDEEFLLATMPDLMGHFIFLVALAGSEAGNYEQWHWDSADWLIQSSSQDPPATAPLIQALAEPASVHPDLVSIALNVAVWAEEGLVKVGDVVEVPAAYRPDVVDLLKDDFSVKAVGPGAATAFI